jgi:hypothetical protein
MISNAVGLFLGIPRYIGMKIRRREQSENPASPVEMKPADGPRRDTESSSDQLPALYRAWHPARIPGLRSRTTPPTPLPLSAREGDERGRGA